MLHSKKKRAQEGNCLLCMLSIVGCLVGVFGGRLLGEINCIDSYVLISRQGAQLKLLLLGIVAGITKLGEQAGEQVAKNTKLK
jgi:hypothetical protein